MDVYSGYNQILMFDVEREKTPFMTKWPNYWYNAMSFGLKNAEVTYCMMMNKICKDKIGEELEVYLNDMIVKSRKKDYTKNI